MFMYKKKQKKRMLVDGASRWITMIHRLQASITYFIFYIL